MILRVAPFLFVLLWSTGFIASKVAAADAEPFTFLALRFALVLAILVVWVIAARIPWPSREALLQAALTGILIHAAYLGGVMWSLRLGMPAGLVAIVVSTQPILTAVLAGPLLGEWPGRRQWAGMPIGLLGVALVLAPKLTLPSDTGGLAGLALVAVLLALVGITFGTLNQKRHGMQGNLMALTLAQYAGAFVVALVVATTTETMEIRYTVEFWLATLWLVAVLSIGAIWLLMEMIRASEVSRVTSLFYLVPAITTLMAAVMFQETITAMQMVGMALVMFAVFAIRSRPRTVVTRSAANPPDGP